MPSSAVELADLMTSLVEGLPAQQQRLDDAYREHLTAITPVLRAAAEQGQEALARALVPAPVVVGRVEIEAGLRFARDRQRGVEVGAEIRLATEVLNLGYARKYAYSEFAQSQLRMVMERVPMEPTAEILPRPSAIEERESTRGEE